MLDGHATTANLISIGKYGYERNSSEGLRDGAMYLLSHYGMLRGHNVRDIELPDMWTMELEEEGHSPCFPLVVTLLNGKTNHDGRLELAGMMRNKDYKRCVLGALAMYLFDV